MFVDTLKKNSIAENGSIPDECADSTVMLQKMIDEAEEGDTVKFPKGTCCISKPLKISKKGICLRGDNTLLLHTGFDPWTTEYQEQTSFFDIDGSTNLTIEGLTLDFKRDTAISGVIASVNPEKSTFTVRVFEEYDWITGNEYYYAINSFDVNGEANYHLASCSGIESTKKIGPCLMEIKYAYSSQLDKITIGEYVNLRMSMTGASAVSIRNSENVCFRDIVVYQAVCNVFLVTPRCKDLLFERVRVEIKPGRRQFMSSNADGIHIVGLLGKIEIRDCFFQALGDDALNIHSRAGIVTSYDEKSNSVDLIDGWKKEAVETMWCSAGDCIIVYDPKTLLQKAKMQVISLENGHLSVEALPENIEQGDVLCNSAFFAAVEIYRTTVCYGRARAFLLQTENVIIEDCNLYNMSLQAILMSPDIVHWYEVGPCKNVVIRNNRIHHCGHIAGDGEGCITVKTFHDRHILRYPAGVHKQIRIENNVITDAGWSGICISSTDGVVIKNNKIFQKYTNGFFSQNGIKKQPIVLKDCTNVICDKDR